MNVFAPIAASAILFSVSTPVTAGDAAEAPGVVSPAQVVVAGCNEDYPVSPGDDTSFALSPLEQQPTTGGDGGAIIAALGGVVGSLTSGAVGALAGAIDDVAKAQSFGGVGYAPFNYYVRSSEGLVRNFSGANFDGRCILITISNPATVMGATQTGPALAARFRFDKLQEGFVLTPVEVQYRTLVPGLRARERRPLQFNATFSMPGTDGDKVFGVAMIALPAMGPGETLRIGQLQGYSSAVIGDRPTANVSTGDGPVGATSVKATLIVYRPLNSFLTSVAAALKGQSAAVGTAVTTDTIAAMRGDVWGVNQSSYYNALETVRANEEQLSRAQATGDEAKAVTARAAVVSSRNLLNEAAGRIGISPPFPDPRSGL